MFEFGVAKRDITPLGGMCIPGYFQERRVGNIIDRLYVKAMVFENNGNVAVTIVCDALEIDRNEVLRIRRGVYDRIGILEKNISVSATHTHTGGPTSNLGSETQQSPRYLNMLVDAAVSATVDAYEKRCPAKIGFAKGEVRGYSFIRRFKMKDGRYVTNPGINNPDIAEPVGAPDYSFIVGKVCDENGKILAFISNYGVHLDMLGDLPGSSNVSADYPGYLAELIKEKYGDGVESVFFTGPCGNTNHIDFLGSSSKTEIDEKYPELPAYKRTALALFDALCNLEKRIVLSNNVIPAVKREFLSARLRKPTYEDVCTAQKILAGEDEVFKGSGIEDFNSDLQRQFALAALAAFNNPIKLIDVEVKAFAFGDTAFVMWPAEVFVEYGQMLRKEFPDKNIIIAELSNGSFAAYLPTEEALVQGSYETAIARAVTPEPRIGMDMVNETVRILREAF